MAKRIGFALMALPAVVISLVVIGLAGYGLLTLVRMMFG